MIGIEVWGRTTFKIGLGTLFGHPESPFCKGRVAFFGPLFAQISRMLPVFQVKVVLRERGGCPRTRTLSANVELKSPTVCERVYYTANAEVLIYKQCERA